MNSDPKPVTPAPEINRPDIYSDDPDAGGPGD